MGAGRANPRGRILRLSDGTPADGDVDQVFRLARNRTRDLSRVWPLSQPRRP